MFKFSLRDNLSKSEGFKAMQDLNNYVEGERVLDGPAASSRKRKFTMVIFLDFFLFSVLCRIFSSDVLFFDADRSCLRLKAFIRSFRTIVQTFLYHKQTVYSMCL